MIFQYLLTVLCLLNVTGSQVHAHFLQELLWGKINIDTKKINIDTNQIAYILDTDDFERLAQIAPHVSEFQINYMARYLENKKHKKIDDFLDIIMPYFSKKHFGNYLIVASTLNCFYVVKRFMEEYRNQISPEDIDSALASTMNNLFDNKEIFEYLLPYATTINEALISAINYGKLEKLQTLMLRADNIDQALRFGAGRRDYKIVEFLVSSARDRELQNVDFNRALQHAVSSADNSKIVSYLISLCSDLSAPLMVSAASYESQVYLELILSQARCLPQEAIDKMFLTILELNSKSINIDAVKPVFDQYFHSVQDPLVLNKMLKSNHPAFKAYCAELDPKMINFYSSFADHDWAHELIHGYDGEETDTEILLRKHKRLGTVFHSFCRKLEIKESSLIGNAGKLDHVVHQIIKIEKDDQKNNRTTFVHGRHWWWNYVNDVWNVILGLENNQSVITDSISLRQRDQNQSVDELYAYRKKLMQEGVVGPHLVSSTNDDCIDRHPDRAEVTFMNYSGLSHLTAGSLSESSIAYFLRNYSEPRGTCGYDYAKELIKKHGLEQYADDFERLAQAHKAASEHGELLTISVHNDHVDEIVYAAKRGGYRYSDEKVSDVIRAFSSKIRSDSGEILLSMNQAGVEEQPIFCAAALDIPGEDSNKYKIQSITLADPEKHKAYLDQRNALFEKIKSETHSNIITWLQSCLVQQSEMFKQSIKNFKFSEHEL